MRKPLIPLLLSLIAVSLCTPVYANVGDEGTFGSQEHGAFINVLENTWVASPYTLTVDANITEFHIYGNTFGPSTSIKVFIYSLDGTVCYYNQQVQWNAYEWYNITGLNVPLVAGTYLMGARSMYNLTRVYKDTVSGNGMNGTVAYNAGWGALSGYNTNNYLSIYANYTEAIVDTSEVTSQMISTDWLTFGGLVFLCILSVVFILKSKNYLLNFIFGTIVFGAGVALLGTNTVLSGWINLLSIIMGLVCMLDAFMIWRNG